MAELSINGLLTERDVQRLARDTRTGTVGPTAVYYAGVTAPIIAGSVALVAQQNLYAAGLSNYWQSLLSALLAASAGIVWYLIFIRWSYRHKFGRGTEIRIGTEIRMNADKLIVKRDDVTTHIGWSAVQAVHSRWKYTVVLIAGADALVIPHRWFGANEKDRLSFGAHINERIGSSQPRLT